MKLNKETQILSGVNLSKNINNLPILKDINITIQKQEMVSIVGPSGAGKTTLLHILSTLDKADNGEVIFNNQRIDNISANQLAKIRNLYFGFIFQFHHLLPEFSAIENILIPAMIAKKNYKLATNRALHLLDKLELENKKDRRPNELSGGEQQRVAIARALINEPLIVFADEPTGNLDSKNAISIQQIFKELNQTFKQSFLIVTHNHQLAQHCDRVIEMQNGKII